MVNQGCSFDLWAQFTNQNYFTNYICISKVLCLGTYTYPILVRDTPMVIQYSCYCAKFLHIPQQDFDNVSPRVSPIFSCKDKHCSACGRSSLLCQMIQIENTFVWWWVRTYILYHDWFVGNMHLECSFLVFVLIITCPCLSFFTAR